MHKNRDGKKSIEERKLEVLLLTEMGFLSSLKRKQIRFNTKPFEKPEPTITEETKTQDNIVDFHLEISRKIDEVIRQHEEETEAQKQLENKQAEFVEFRKPWTKKVDMPRFKTDLEPLSETIIQDEELFELETPENITITPITNIGIKVPFTQPKIIENTEKKNFEQTVLTGIGDTSQDILTSLGRIKVRKTSNVTPQKKTRKQNGYTVAKKDYESVQHKLEEKKKEIEEMERLAKLKEEELKRKKHEKAEKERQRKLQLKKQAKLEKQKQAEAKKLQKQKEIQKRKKERLEQLELKKLEKQKQIEKKKKEKQKKLHAATELKEQKLKERELAEKQKNKEKEKEKLEFKKLEKQKQIEARKKEKQQKLQAAKELKEQKLKEKELAKQQKQKKEKKGFFKTKEPAAKTEKQVKKEIQPELKVETQKTDNFDEEVKEALDIIDELLGKLPEETIDEFVQSKDFEIYEKVVSKYKNK